MSGALRFEQATRRFGGRTAVADVSLECSPGRATKLLGPNGAGKSTLLAMGAGLLPASSGRVTLAGQPLSPARPSPSTGFLPQRSAFHPLLLVREVLAFATAARQATADEGRRAVRVAGLEQVVDRPVGELSGGWIRRLGIACAVLGTPAVLLLDEPYVGLDPDTTERFTAHLQARLADGAIVAVASHDFESVDGLEGSLVVIDEGRIVATSVSGPETARAFYRATLGRSSEGGADTDRALA